MTSTSVKGVAYAAAQGYLKDKFNLRPVSIHTQREWIKARKFPPPIEISRSNKIYTEQMLDDYANGLFEQAS
jgi:hypothetical protein